MSELSLEQRVAALEVEVERIKEQLRLIPPCKPNPNWVDEVAGSMKDFPEFDEVRRFVREAREAELAEFDSEMERKRDDPGEG